ncbi:MAG: rod shape-determining protein MreC [Candidatus Omnitrophota bacterium]|nr:rod shape-determining protein MreC [Candidatus Omnitrophota bacterium]
MRLKHGRTFLPLIAIPIVLLLIQPSVSQQTHNLTAAFLKPALWVASGASFFVRESQTTVSNFWGTFHEQEQDKRRIVELESEVAAAGEVEKENLRLKKLLDFREEVKAELIAARVIAWDVSPWRKTLILDKGSAHGIKRDMAVITPEGLVGRVLTLGPITTHVIMLSDAEARVSAILSESRAHGVVSGDGSPVLKMHYLDLDSEAQVGETVLTSGLTGIFPKGLRIGRVESVTRASDGLHLVAYVKPFAPLTRIEEVLCRD